MEIFGKLQHITMPKLQTLESNKKVNSDTNNANMDTVLKGTRTSLFMIIAGFVM